MPHIPRLLQARRSAPRHSIFGWPRRKLRRLLPKRPSGRTLLALALIVSVIAGLVGGLLRFSTETTIESFLPANDPAVADLQRKAQDFGGDPIVVLLESNQPHELLLKSEQLRRLVNLEGELSRLPHVDTVYGPGSVLNQTAIAVQNILARISGRRDALRAQAEHSAREKGMSSAKIDAAGDRAVADFEKRYGSLVVKGLPAGLPTLHNQRFVRNVIYDQTGQPRAQWHFVVPSERGVAILVRPQPGLTQSDTTELVSAVRAKAENAALDTERVTITGIPAVTAGVADQVADELPLIGALVVFVLLLRFLLAPPRSGGFRRLMPLAAAVIGSALTAALFGWLGIPLSFGAVALLPVLLGVGSSFPLYLRVPSHPRRVVVVALASAAAFAALALSPLPFVRELGLALAVGVVFTVAVALGFTRLWGQTRIEPKNMGGELEPRRPVSAARRWGLLAVAVLLAGAGWASLPNATVQADPRELARGLPALSDAEHAEDVLGSSGEISIVLSGADVQTPAALEWARTTEQRIIAEYGDRVHPAVTLSGLLNFLGESPSQDEVTAGIQLLPSYLTSSVISPDGQSAAMTFGLEIQDLGNQARLLDSLRTSLPQPPAGLDVDVVGLPVAADRAYELVSGDRYVANVAGIVAGILVLLVGLANRRDGVRGLLASVLATGWTLGLLWAFDSALSPLTVAVGCLVSVTACEFSVMLSGAQRRRDNAIRKCVRWAVVTSALGFLAIIPSSFWLLRDFGLVLTATVLLSYGAALMVSWAWPAGVNPQALNGQTESSAEWKEFAR